MKYIPRFEVTTLRVNFNKNELTRVRKPMNRWIFYRMIQKFKFGIPLEYIALQYEISMGELVHAIEIGLKYSKQLRKRDYAPRAKVFMESFQFFYWLGTPVHIIARLYRTTPDEVVNAIKNPKFKMAMFSHAKRVRVLYKDGMAWEYKNTPEGKLMYKKVKEMIRWRE